MKKLNIFNNLTHVNMQQTPNPKRKEVKVIIET